MLYDPITGLKTLGLEKVQITVSALKAGAWYPIEWIHETVDFPEMGGKLVITTSTIKRFKIDRNHVPAVKVAEDVRQCKDEEMMAALIKAMELLSESQKAALPANIVNMFEEKKAAIARGEAIHSVKKKETDRKKDRDYPFLFLCKNHNILLDCHQANVKDIRTGKYRKSTFKYYWVTDGVVRELPSDAAIISNPKTVAAMAKPEHKYKGGTDFVTPSVFKIVRIHKTYAE